MRILLLHNDAPTGLISDLDTLEQAKSITNALTRLGHEVITRQLKDSLDEIAIFLEETTPELVFNLVESFQGSDAAIYKIAEYLEQRNISFTGCNSKALLQTADKVNAKRIMLANSINTPEILSEADNDNIGTGAGQDDQETLYIVKSKTEHASFGIDVNSVVKGAQAAFELMTKKKQQLHGEWFAEEYIAGREINLPIFGNQECLIFLPCYEYILLAPENKYKIVDYEAKWISCDLEKGYIDRRFLDTALEAKLIDNLQKIATKCWQVFGLTGYARIDFRVNEAGEAFVLEINCNPGLSEEDSMEAAIEVIGKTYDDLINMVLSEAV